MKHALASLGMAGGLARQDGVWGTGTFLLTSVIQQVGNSGQSRHNLTLEDASGRLTGFVWPEHQAHITYPAVPSPVVVSGTVQVFNGQPQFKVMTLSEVDPDHLVSASKLLPRSRCPERAVNALFRLQKLEAELPEPLRGFLRRVLLDPSLGILLLRCRASGKHHHSFVGGLLVHCTEMLDAVGEQAGRSAPDDDLAPYMAQLGYLLHDIGKLRTVGETLRPMYAMVVRHETLNAELLARHLHWLDGQRPDLSTALRYIFEYLALPQAARGRAKYAPAEIIAMFDQLSASAYSSRGLEALLDRGKGKTPRVVQHLPPSGVSVTAIHGKGEGRVEEQRAQP